MKSSRFIVDPSYYKAGAPSSVEVRMTLDELMKR